MSKPSEPARDASHDSSGLKLPFRVSVSLRAGFVLSLANVLCAGIIAFAWAIGLAVYIYFGLIAVGTSGAFAIVIAMVSAFGIWLLIRLRGADSGPT